MKTKRIKTLGKQLSLLLVSILLFSQISQTDWPYLGKEYVVLFAIQLYFAATYLIIPKLILPRLKGDQRE